MCAGSEMGQEGGVFVGLILRKAWFYCTMVRRRLEHSGLGVFLDRLMVGFVV